MQKQLSLTLAAAITLSGCSAFQSSPTWKTVVENRAHGGPSNSGKEEYAEQLHAVLASDHVEHKVVTYQYHYHTRLREEAVNAAAAVIYRDSTTPNNPWWLMDDTLGFPVWLPNGDTARQLTFYLRRPAEVLEEKNYAGDSEHKSVARLTPPPTRLQVAQVQAQTKARKQVAQQPANRPARKLFATTQPVVVRVQPKGTPAPKAPVAVHRQGTKQAPLSNRLFPGQKRMVWAAPSKRSKASQGSDPTYAELFRAHNGTVYDPSSPMDREKMLVLRQRFFQRHATAQLR